MFKLDKRIRHKSDIQSLLNYDPSFLGVSSGYFSNDLAKFRDLSLCHYGKLHNIDDEDTVDTLFITVDEDGNYQSWSFFIPDSYLLPKEIQVRPFISEEWKNKFKIGTVLTLRYKETQDTWRLMYLGYNPTNLGLEVLIGNEWHSLEDLSEFWEYYDEASHKWVPFGIVM